MTYIYVLVLEQHKFYVGKTNNISQRKKDHISGKFGSAWTKKYKPVIPVRLSDKFIDDGYQELSTVLWYMEHYGIQNVRGADYCNINLSTEQIAEIKRHINAENGRCYKCGSSDHYISNCKYMENLGWLRRICRFLCDKKTVENDEYIQLKNIIRFGKYKGKTYEEVQYNNPSYCDWVLSQSGSQNSDFKQFQDWLKNYY